MSGTTLRMIIAFGGILAVFWATQHVANVENASVEVARNKEQLLRAQTKIRHTEKVKGPLASEINLVGSAENGVAGQALVLQATVTATKEVKGAKLKWILPAGVQLLSGTLDATIASVSPKQPFQTQITVQQKDPSNQQIHFVVSGEQPGIHFSSVSQYNTSDEEFLLEQKDLVLKSLQESDHKKAGHVFH